MAKMKKLINKFSKTLNENKWLVLPFKTQFEVSMQLQNNGSLEKAKKIFKKQSVGPDIEL